jgi:hypothetical protein
LRGRRSEPHLLAGPGQWEPREWHARGGGRRGQGGEASHTCWRGRVNGAARGVDRVDVAVRGVGRGASGGVEATRGAGKGSSGGVGAARGAGNGARRLGWRWNQIGLEKRVEIGGWRGASKGKHNFVENNVTRDEYAVGDKVKTTIPLVVRGVTEEEATSGARR